MRLGVLTGTFGYGALVKKIVEALPELSCEYSSIKIQYGEDSAELREILREKNHCSGADLHLVNHYADLEDFTKEIDAIVTHAGTGTVLELLKANKKFMVVPNPALKNNHQEEFAGLLREKQIHVSTTKQIVEDLLKKKFTLQTVSVTEDVWQVISAMLVRDQSVYSKEKRS